MGNDFPGVDIDVDALIWEVHTLLTAAHKLAMSGEMNFGAVNWGGGLVVSDVEYRRSAVKLLRPWETRQ